MIQLALYWFYFGTFQSFCIIAESWRTTDTYKIYLTSRSKFQCLDVFCLWCPVNPTLAMPTSQRSGCVYTTFVICEHPLPFLRNRVMILYYFHANDFWNVFRSTHGLKMFPKRFSQEPCWNVVFVLFCFCSLVLYIESRHSLGHLVLWPRKTVW